MFGLEPLSPAYGRDYKTAEEAQKDFDAGKDFASAAGPYVSKSELPPGKYRVRFAKLRKTGFVEKSVMKIKPEHFAILETAIKQHDTPERRARYLKGDFPRSDRTKDLNKRYRWDLLWEFVGTTFITMQIYQYANDDHIDTALRNIVGDIK